jgi:hypothetical protein
LLASPAGAGGALNGVAGHSLSSNGAG